MTSEDVLEELFEGRQFAVSFTRRGEAIPGDLRVAWRLAVLCLILFRFWGNRAAMEHLHTLWWAVRSEANREVLARWFAGDRRPDDVLVRFDPSLSATLDLALGQHLIEIIPSGAITLTPSGVALAQAAGNQQVALLAEKEFLDRLPKKLTQKALREIVEWR